MEGKQYQVNLPIFEGPMDLLLHLVQKNRIDIHDIPIHEITDQYMNYLEKAQALNLDLKSSFFAMAATLIYIKSRMLLPKKRQEDPGEEEDPRQELARSLTEFKRMKEMKSAIESLLSEEDQYRLREPEEFHSHEFAGQISLKKLSAAFFSLYESVKEEEKERILPKEEVSIEDKIYEWETLLAREKHVSVISYFRKQKTKLSLAVSFMALLELIRLHRVKIRDTAKGLEIVQVG